MSPPTLNSDKLRRQTFQAKAYPGSKLGGEQMEGNDFAEFFSEIRDMGASGTLADCHEAGVAQYSRGARPYSTVRIPGAS